MKKPIYYDTETTGVKSDRDRIVEIAAYDPVNKRSFVQLINPLCPIPPEATAISKITDEMVATAPSFETVGRSFIEFCGKENVVLIAHNNDRFDQPFLEAECLRSNLQLPAWKYVDTLQWARKYRSDLRSHSLQALREVYGIPPNQAHRALDDVMVLHRLFTSMIGDLSIETVLELLSAAPLLRMPFGKYQGRPLEEVPPSYVHWMNQNGVFDKADNKALKAHFEKMGFL